MLDGNRMRIYWSLNSVPELAALPKMERKRVWRTCYHRTFRHWQTWLALLFCGLCGGAGVQIGKFIFEDGWMMLVCAGICGGIGGFIFGQVATQIAIPYIRQELLHRSSNAAV